MPDFLLEIGCEEIPARMLDAGVAQLHQRVVELLQRERLEAKGKVNYFSTPRRLTVVASGLPLAQPDMQEQVQGPAVKIAYKDGAPTAAAEAFARKVNLPLEKLERSTTAKGEYLSARVTKKGRSTAEVLAELLPKEIATLHWPKSMYWRAGAPERFVRPIRWLVAMLDEEIVPLEFAGVRAGAVSYGHRLLIGKVNIKSADAYQLALQRAKVEPSREERQRRIQKGLAEAATKSGGRCREDKELLDTVVNLTEWPAVILGDFDPSYLQLPGEVLVTVMRDHQKYFAVEDAGGKLLPHFLAVLNTEGDPDAMVRHGNERVLRARFNDARFFWDTDQKISLLQRVDKLKTVTFQKDLGSYYDKAQRVEKLADWLASELAKSRVAIDEQAVKKAAQLAKTDLTTELVKEFTELQGVVGGLYARAQGLDQKVADAIYDHYKPASMEDSAPRTIEGAVLSIADKADTIAGMFALGMQPTGSKDPFALRRQANGMVRILAEKNLHLGLTQLLTSALEQVRRINPKLQISIDPEVEGERIRLVLRPLDKSGFYVAPDEDEAEGSNESPTTIGIGMARFFQERLEFYLRDSKGFAQDVVKAILNTSSDDVSDAVKRAEAVSRVRNRPEFVTIAIAFKRMKNIFKQARNLGLVEELRGVRFRRELLRKEEVELYPEMQIIGTSFLHLRENRQYDEALRELAKFGPYIDAYFEKVMVMAEDEQLRNNRLRFLSQLGRSFSGIADFSEIVTEGKNA
jgi:glycyl-tRNA synthetase beta chain